MDFNSFVKTLYEAPTTPKQIIEDSHKAATVDEWERMEVIDGKGIFVYLKNQPHPVKGCPTPAAMEATNIVKRVILNGARVLPLSSFTTLVHAFNRITYGIMSPYIIRHEFMNPVAKEFKLLIYNFLRNLSISPDQADLASKTLSHIVEYDNAYRYRLQHVLSNTTSKKDLPTFRELRRLGRLLYAKDDQLDQSRRRVGKQSKALLYKLSYLTLIPRIRRALHSAIDDSHWSEFDIDASDRYWMDQRQDYDFKVKAK